MPEHFLAREIQILINSVVVQAVELTTSQQVKQWIARNKMKTVCE